MLALYLANPPEGAPEVYLILATASFVLGAGAAVLARTGDDGRQLAVDIWRGLTSLGLAFLVLALLTR